MKFLIAIGLVLLAAVAVISVSSLNEFLNAVRAGERAHRTRGDLDRLYEVLLAAESDQRGYLLSRKPEYLRSYFNRSEKIPMLLQNLSEGSSEQEQEKLDQLKKLVHVKMRALDKNLFQSRTGFDHDTAADIMPKTLPSIRLLLDEMDFAAKNDAVIHERFVQSASSFFVSLIVAASTIAILIFAFFWYLVLRESRLHAKTEAELRVAEAAARAASDLKSKFLPAVSHEIRTPLNGIIGMSDLLQNRLQDPQQKRFVEIIQNSGESILKIVNDILELSKIEAGALQLDSVQFSTEKLVSMAAELLVCQAREKNISITIHTDPDIPDQLQGDAPRISQILRNLLANAVKFTREGGVVAHARLKKRTDNKVLVRFEVVDSGPGVPEAQLPLVFEPFYQLMSDEDRQDGAGLGLSICKSLVEQMGGSMGAESELRKGSLFWFEVPLLVTNETSLNSDDAEEGAFSDTTLRQFASGQMILLTNKPFLEKVFESYASEFKMKFRKLRSLVQFKTGFFSVPAPILIFIDLDAHDLIELSREIDYARKLAHVSVILLTNSEVDELDQGLIHPPVSAFLRKPFGREDLLSVLSNRSVSRCIQSARSQRQLHTFSESRRKSGLLLLAEDDPVNRILAEAVLNDHGYQIDCVGNGEEAVEAARTTRYDLILMDCQLPMLSGYEATKRIRALESEHGHRVPIIAVTAHASISDRQKCLASGMDDVVNKPWKNRELAQTVAKWIGGEDLEPIDWSVLQDLKDKTSANITGRLIDSFLTTLPQSLDAIESELQKNNWPKVKYWAHRLKSSSATLGAKRLSEHCRRLEELIEAGPLSDDSLAHHEAGRLLESGRTTFDTLREKVYLEAT